MTAFPKAQTGFTLVEMMVALAIFAMLSAAGVALLQSASNTQLAVKDRLNDVGRNARAIALMEADLAQAIVRPVRSGTTNLPAFAAVGSEATGQLFALTRGGAINLDNAPRPEIQRVVYSFEQGELRRAHSAMVDGGAMQVTPLLTNVASVAVRFRDSEGSWRADWDALDETALPRALELTVTQKRMAPVRIMLLVGTGLPVDKTVGEEGSADENPA